MRGSCKPRNLPGYCIGQNEGHEVERAGPTPLEPDTAVSASPLIAPKKADEWEGEECGDKGRNAHDKHLSYPQHSHKLGKEKDLECASTHPIESQDVSDAHRVKAYSACFQWARRRNVQVALIQVSGKAMLIWYKAMDLGFHVHHLK